MTGKIQTVILLTFVALTSVAYATPKKLPVSYTITSPLVASDDRWQVTVYQSEELAIARHHMKKTSVTIEDLLSSGARMYIAGEPTNGMLGKYQNVGRSAWQVRTLRSVKENEQYENKRFDEIKWSVKNLNINMKRGSDDQTVASLDAEHYIVTISYDYFKDDTEDDDKGETKTITATRHFWFHKNLPFSPVQLLPLHTTNYTFANMAPERIHEAIYKELRKDLEGKGMLVQTRLESAGKTHTITIQDIKETKQLDLTPVLSMPVLDEANVQAVQGPLFMAKMLNDSKPPKGNAQLTLTEGGKEISSHAGYKVSGMNDFVIAMPFKTKEGQEGMLLLMRPYHGMPEAGSYKTTGLVSKEELKKLAKNKLIDRARHFQVIGVLEFKEQLTVFTEGTGGEITLKKIANNTIDGSFSIKANFKNLTGERNSGNRHIKGNFHATQGMAGYFRSPTSMLLR